MSVFKAYKLVSLLPPTLEPNSIYAVRVGEGFDLYISDSTGSIAHALNPNASNFTFVWDGGASDTNYFPITLDFGESS